MDNSTMINKINYATDICNELMKEGFFDPFAVMMSTESKKQKLYRYAVEFLYEIEEAVNRFDNNKKKCI